MDVIVRLPYHHTERTDNSRSITEPPDMRDALVSFGSLAQKELPLHRNIGMEVVYLSEGRLRWIVEDHTEDIAPGSLFFTLPWQEHGSVYEHEPGNRIHFLQFRLDQIYRRPVKRFGFHPHLGVPPSRAKSLSTIFSQTKRHTWPASPEFKWILLTLLKRLEAKADPLFIHGLFLSMLAELADVVSGLTTERSYLNPTERRVHDLITRLDAECDDKWDLRRITAETRLGATQLAGIFRKLTGDSPIAYLNRRRIARAEELLRSTDKSITDIGFECGYSTTPLFCRTFKRFTNRTPTQYRRGECTQTPRHVIDWTEAEEHQRHKAIRDHEWL
jgi:AraC-like DNA-binding protein/quercetin dioxygenase-like cupin family protein